MFKLTVSVKIPNLDKHWIRIPCPVCDLETPATLGAVRLGDVIVCRGCHANIRLQDHLGTLHRFERRLVRTLQAMEM
jgi:hypothetical protein